MFHYYKDLRDIWGKRELIITLAESDFRKKFIGSFLGVCWMFVQPITTVLIYFFVFQLGFRSRPVSDVPYVLWLIPGIVPWFFFNEAWGGATNCLYEYQHLVKKMVFKVSILPIIKVTASFFIHLIFIWIMLIVYLLFGIKPSVWWLQLFYYSFCTAFLVLGLSYITASANVFFKDILHRQKFIFLDHGVIKDDLSRWLARANKDINLFITTTKREWKSVLECNYDYDETQVKCTGLPRYDYLYDNIKKKKTITFMPTWRAYLAGKYDVKTDSRILYEGFENSTYCQMYQQVFWDNRLYEAAEKYGYEIQLLWHPVMPRECIEYIGHDSRIKILDKGIRYKGLFAETALIVTDYSSVVFDFVYLSKPVIYYQKDMDEFYSGQHTYDKGYFDYEQDGFGEVEYTAERLVDRIIDYMRSDCQLKDIYRKRIEQTFLYHDRNNCKRVYEEIRKL